MNLKNFSMLAALAVSSFAFAETTTTVHAQIGGTMTGGPADAIITSLFSPAINPAGNVAVTGVYNSVSLAANIVFIGYNGVYIGSNNDITAFTPVSSFPLLTWNNSLQYNYAPSQTVGATSVGNVAGNGGAVKFKNGDPAVGHPGNFILNTFRNQTMTDGSVATLGLYGLDPNLVATANVAGRNIYLRSSAGIVSRVFGSGDVLDGATASTVFSDYDFSNNGVRKIFGANVTGATSTTDGRVFSMNGAAITVLAREGSSTGAGDNWGFFNLPGTNNAGTTYWTGTTSNVDLNAKQVLVIDGSIVVRGTDTLDQLALSSVTVGVTTATVSRGAVMNDAGFVAHIWGDATKFALFLGNKDAILGSRLILKNGDRIDTDGDYVADTTIDTVEGSSGNGLMIGLSDDLTISLRAKYTKDGDPVQKQGILSIPVSLPGDANRDGFRGFDDFDILSATFGASPGDANWDADADFNFDGFDGFDDFDILSANFGS